MREKEKCGRCIKEIRNIVTWHSVTFNPLTPLRRSEIQIKAKTHSLMPSSQWSATQITALYRVSPASEYRCLWLAQRAPGGSVMCLKQTNWFCFLSLMCTCESVHVHKLPAVHTHAQIGFIYGGKHYQECMNAHVQTHNQTTNTHNFDTHLGSCRQREILKLSLGCSLVFESNSADTCYGSFINETTLLRKKKKSKARKRNGRR